MKRAFIVDPLSLKVSPVSGSLITMLEAHSVPFVFNLLTPVKMIAATSGQIAQLIQHIHSAEAAGKHRETREQPVMETTIV